MITGTGMAQQREHLPPIDVALKSIPAQSRYWIEIVVGFRLALRGFLWVLWFLSLPKSQHLQNSNLTRIEGPHEN